MKTGGLKRTVVLGMAGAALALMGGCRNERAQVPANVQEQQAPATGGAGQAGTDEQRPVDINRLPNQEGFKTVPERQAAPNGIGSDTQSSEPQRPVDINPLPNQEGFKTAPQSAPNGIGQDTDSHGSSAGEQPRQ